MCQNTVAIEILTKEGERRIKPGKWKNSHWSTSSFFFSKEITDLSYTCYQFHSGNTKAKNQTTPLSVLSTKADILRNWESWAYWLTCCPVSRGPWHTAVAFSQALPVCWFFRLKAAAFSAARISWPSRLAFVSLAPCSSHLASPPLERDLNMWCALGKSLWSQGEFCF